MLSEDLIVTHKITVIIVTFTIYRVTTVSAMHVALKIYYVCVLNSYNNPAM